MKYKIGDHVKYDSGEWRFYGTVSAVVENSISPCYRIVVERMEKLNCAFSSMQFEFELEIDSSRSSGGARNRISESTETAAAQLSETAAESIDVLEQAATTINTQPAVSEIWMGHLEAYANGDRSRIVRAWARDNTLTYRAGKLKSEKLELLQKIDFPFDAIKSKEQLQVQEQPQEAEAEAETASDPSEQAITASWKNNLQEYINGVRSDKVEDWVYQTRKRYKDDTLPQELIEMLEDVNFEFEPETKYPDNEKEKSDKAKRKHNSHGTPITSIWEHNRQAFIKGERAGKVEDWMRRNRRNYEQGKLSDEKLEKLIEINFPFGDTTATGEVPAPKPEPESITAWDRNFKAYLKGEKSSLVNMWIFHNRKQYKAGKLTEEKFDKLVNINFPFEVNLKK